jgi:hypothetical protein
VNTTPSESEPTILGNLVASGLVNHELIGDPARLPGETAILRALCRHVAGPVYRIAPFHYAFGAAPGDLEGKLADLPQSDWAEAIEALLVAEFGAEAAWVSSTDLLPQEDSPLPEAPVLMLRAWGMAATEGIRAAGPELHAVINARFAAQAATVLAAQSVEKIEPALAALDARLAALEATLETRLDAGLAGLTATLEAGLADLGRRLEAHGASETAARMAHEELLGLTLAEFLARLETGPGLRRPLAAGSPIS